MSIIKEKIRFTGNDINLRFGLNTDNNLYGLQQEIDRYTQISTSNSINEGNDLEVRRFKFGTINETHLSFLFWNGTSYNNSFQNAGFTSNEINNKTKDFLNSYFILDFYDSFDTNTQNKFKSFYLTKFTNGYLSRYEIKKSIQYYNLLIPINFFENYTGTTITGYTRFSFFNAKTGEIKLFYNQDNENFKTPEKFYFKTILNLENMTWDVDTESFNSLTPKYIYAKELKYENNKEYIDKYRNTYNNFENKQIVYPTGNTFNYETGKYIET